MPIAFVQQYTVNDDILQELLATYVNDYRMLCANTKQSATNNKLHE